MNTGDKDAKATASKLRNTAGWLLIIASVLIGIIAAAIHWTVCVGWLAFVCYVIAYACHELSKDIEKKEGKRAD